MTSTLPIVESFHSIQGEGAHAGRSAFFIRLASCNVGCHWCDTKNSWSAKSHPQLSIHELAHKTTKAVTAGAAFVVITGGEPLHHNLDELSKAIREATVSKSKKNIPIHLETSGVDPLSGSPNWITLSPKRHAHPCTELLEKCQELKVIIHDQEDLDFAKYIEEIILSVKRFNRPLLFIQPEWESSKGQSLAIDHVKHNPQWKLSLQTHKWLGVH